MLYQGVVRLKGSPKTLLDIMTLLGQASELDLGGDKEGMTPVHLNLRGMTSMKEKPLYIGKCSRQNMELGFHHLLAKSPRMCGTTASWIQLGDENGMKKPS